MNSLSPEISQMKQFRNSLIDYLSSKLPSNSLPIPPGMRVTDPGTWQGAGNVLMQFAIPQPEDTLMGMGFAKPLIAKTGLGKPKVNIGWRGEHNSPHGFGASEGEGLYVAKNKDLAEFFGKPKKIEYFEPRNPLIVDNEPLPILHELDVITEPIIKTDTPWIKLNKQAYQNLKMTDETWDSDLVAKELTKLLKKEGYDAVSVRSGDDAWDVILDNNLIRKR